MRHPLTGGGMTVALHDAVLLANSLKRPLNLTNVREIRSRTDQYYVRRKPWAATINTLANALYKVFCSDGSAWREEMRNACFDYLCLGGSYSNQPISLLGGLTTDPSVLVSHFLMVALYGVGRVVLPVPSPRSLLMALNLLTGALLILLPIIKAEGPTQVFAPSLSKARHY
jgi:squalene monooxygenase